MDRWIKNPALAKAANILLRAFFSPVGAECLNLGGYFLGGKGIIEKSRYAKINIVELARIWKFLIGRQRGVIIVRN